MCMTTFNLTTDTGFVTNIFIPYTSLHPVKGLFQQFYDGFDVF